MNVGGSHKLKWLSTENPQFQNYISAKVQDFENYKLFKISLSFIWFRFWISLSIAIAWRNIWNFLTLWINEYGEGKKYDFGSKSKALPRPGSGTDLIRKLFIQPWLKERPGSCGNRAITGTYWLIGKLPSIRDAVFFFRDFPDPEKLDPEKNQN